MAGAHGSSSGDLARGAIGLREVLFQSITSMAPAGAVALSIAAGATYAGGALPLSVLLALVGCLLVASVLSLAALSYLYLRHPERLPQMRRVFADDELTTARQPVASGEAM
jgi:hypothetical protein